MQWVVSWYGMGKTSLPSAFNIPGRVAWMTMESPGFLTLLYILNTVPRQHGIVSLPWQNRLLGGLFVRLSSFSLPSPPPWAAEALNCESIFLRLLLMGFLV